METLRVAASVAIAPSAARPTLSPSPVASMKRCESSSVVGQKLCLPRQTRQAAGHVALGHRLGKIRVQSVAADGGDASQGSAFGTSGASTSNSFPPYRSFATGAAPASAPQMIRSDPRHEKLMKMQKELLEQLEEKRRLHAALLQSMEDPAATIKAFNASDKAGLPPLGARPPPPGAPTSASPGPAVTAKPSTPQPPLSPSSRAPPPPAPASYSPANLSPPAAMASTTMSPPRGAGMAASGVAPPRATPSVKPATSPISLSIPSAPSRQWSPSPPVQKPTTAAPAPFAPPPRTSAAPPPPAAAAAAAPVAPPRSAAPPPPVAPPPKAAPKLAFVPRAAPEARAAPAPAPSRKPMEAPAKAAPAEPPKEEKPPPLAGPHVMNVVMVASECAPWSKTGGLGDVVGALPKALARRGHRVMVVVPRYNHYSEAIDTNVRKRFNVAGQDMEVGYFHHYRDDVDFVFVDHGAFHMGDRNIYSGSREEVTKRMILLCKSAIEAPWHVPCGGVCYGDGNLVFMANDWHTALLPVYLQAYYRDNGMMQFARSMLVIHNMAHQGRGPVAEYPWLGLPEHFMDRFKLFDPIGGEHINIFMAGLISAHRIVAVSHGYAWEIQTQMGGWGLDAVLRDHNMKLRGVVNGIDVQEWSPDVDAFLLEDGYQQYSTDSLEKKAHCKAALQRELGLPERPDVPLLGFIGRLDYQKGVDIIGEAMPWIASQDCQLVMLGTGRQDLEDALRSFEGSHRDKVRGWVGFSVKMAHRITAGCDILLMPSRFEPCGLNQLYAMRYGTVPVVHAVGGLRDTVQAFDPFNDSGLGWTFDKAEAGGLIHALGNAMYTYKDYKDSWKRLQLRGMTQDLSWDHAAQQYEDVLVEAKYTW